MPSWSAEGPEAEAQWQQMLAELTRSATSSEGWRSRSDNAGDEDDDDDPNLTPAERAARRAQRRISQSSRALDDLDDDADPNAPGRRASLGGSAALLSPSGAGSRRRLNPDGTYSDEWSDGDEGELTGEVDADGVPVRRKRRGFNETDRAFEPEDADSALSDDDPATAKERARLAAEEAARLEAEAGGLVDEFGQPLSRKPETEEERVARIAAEAAEAQQQEMELQRRREQEQAADVEARRLKGSRRKGGRERRVGPNGEVLSGSSDGSASDSEGNGEGGSGPGGRRSKNKDATDGTVRRRRKGPNGEDLVGENGEPLYEDESSGDDDGTDGPNSRYEWHVDENGNRVRRRKPGAPSANGAGVADQEEAEEEEELDPVAVAAAAANARRLQLEREHQEYLRRWQQKVQVEEWQSKLEAEWKAQEEAVVTAGANKFRPASARHGMILPTAVHDDATERMNRRRRRVVKDIRSLLVAKPSASNAAAVNRRSAPL